MILARSLISPHFTNFDCLLLFTKIESKGKICHCEINSKVVDNFVTFPVFIDLSSCKQILQFIMLSVPSLSVVPVAMVGKHSMISVVWIQPCSIVVSYNLTHS